MSENDEFPVGYCAGSESALNSLSVFDSERWAMLAAEEAKSKKPEAPAKIEKPIDPTKRRRGVSRRFDYFNAGAAICKIRYHESP